MIVAVLLVAAYLLGSIPFGVLLARAKGVDLFTIGSGNIGATNVQRALGKGPALAVLFLDILKGAIPAGGAVALKQSPEVAFAVGLAAVLGHCASVFLRFRGGKGVATGLGALLGSAPIVGLCALGVFLAMGAVSRIVSLSSVVAALSLIAFGLMFGSSPTMIAIYVAFAAFLIYRHRANLRRLWEGTEPKFDLKKKSINEDSGASGSNRGDMSIRPTTRGAAPTAKGRPGA